MNVKEWAALTGIAYITARRQYAAGTLPVPTYRIGRLIMVGEPVTGAVAGVAQVMVYAGVSSAEQEPDLDRQAARVTMWATGQHLAVSRVVTEVDPADVDDDLVRDVTEILTCRCARLYGRRAAADRARRAVDAATGPGDPR